MTSPFQLVLFHPDGTKLDALRRHLTGQDAVVFLQGNAIDANVRLPLDALFVTPMTAYEFGINPPLTIHEAQVFAMPLAQRQRGFPRLMIAGVSLVPGRTYAPEYLGRVTIEALSRAVETYNLVAEEPILRVGALPSVLGLEGPNAEYAISALEDLARASQPDLVLRSA